MNEKDLVMQLLVDESPINRSLPFAIRRNIAVKSVEMPSAVHRESTLGYRLSLPPSLPELFAARMVEVTRVKQIRSFDQIPMRYPDMAVQVMAIAPCLAGMDVAFIGDNDGASRLLGILARREGLPAPRSMTIFDFDERILERTLQIAELHGFADIIRVERYNVFDALPQRLVGQFDWFYTNPPYGASNEGKSIRLFAERGMELCRPGQGWGCIIAPDEDNRPWAAKGMRECQMFFLQNGWRIAEKHNRIHSYHLDEDKGLTSGVLIVRSDNSDSSSSPNKGKHVALTEIPFFYGKRTSLPYPRYIRHDGTFEYDWRSLTYERTKPTK